MPEISAGHSQPDTPGGAPIIKPDGSGGLGGVPLRSPAGSSRMRSYASVTYGGFSRPTESAAVRAEENLLNQAQDERESLRFGADSGKGNAPSPHLGMLRYASRRAGAKPVPHREQKYRNRSKSPLSYLYGDEALHACRSSVW